MFEINTRIKYSETDPEGNLTIESLVNAFQDCSYYESEDCGLGLDYLSKHNIGWFVFFWQIGITHCPRIGENIKVGTFPYSLDGVVEKRNYYLKNSTGEIIVRAQTVSSLVDLEDMKIVKVPSLIKQKSKLQNRLDMNYRKRRIVIPKNIHFTEKEKSRIHYSQLDSNRHLNNAQFLKIAMDSLENGINGLSHISIEYKEQAKLGDLVISYVAVDKERTFIDLRSEQGNTYAMVELEKAAV